MNTNKKRLAIWIGLALAILIVYTQVHRFDFINYDDPEYVSVNPHVQAGLTPGSIKSAFTKVVVANWVPVTMLSHIATRQVFGMRSGMHHLVNVLLHMLAALLLFAVLQRASGELGASAFVAFIFALHPLHVESVAWIAERKDVLSACFFFLALYAYVRYTEKPSMGRYLPVVVAFGLGLMAKPMVVTFPFVLMLFDVWPLRRIEWPKILLEKLPLIALSAAASGMTYFIQSSTGAVEHVRLSIRLENAFISYVTYIVETFWPTGLAPFYPFPKSIETWQAAVAFAVILGLSTLAVLAWRSRPYFTVGWFWYLGTLVPVIGLVQAGSQSHADRYMYIPMVGLTIVVAWGAVDVFTKWPRTKPVIAAVAVLSCAMCMALAWTQTAYWQNSETLFRHTLEVTEDNWVAHGNLGLYLMTQPGRRAEAVDHLEATLRINPEDTGAGNNLAACLIEAGFCDAAVPHLEAVLRAIPNDREANSNLGVCLLNSGRNAEAVDRFEAALSGKGSDATSHFNLGLALSKVPGRSVDAIAQYEAGLQLSPDAADAHRSLGQLYLSLGRKEEAAAQLAAAQPVR